MNPLLSLLLLCASLALTTIAYAESINCGRTIYPRGVVLDLSAIDEITVSPERCQVQGGVVSCNNETTGDTVCFKCFDDKKWQNVKDHIYRCVAE